MEQPLLLIFCLTFLIIYLAFLGFAIFNWMLSGSSHESSDTSSLLKVSVIVCARNEELTLPGLIESFHYINYPSHLLEIIIINDQSTDNTALVLEKLKSKYKLNINLLSNDYSSSTPKKEALNLGIKNSSGEILLFTDADCVVHPGWVEQIAGRFNNKKVNLVFGPIAYAKSNNLEKLLSIEQAALLGSAVTSLKMRIPSMCNGANMAVRRIAFDKIDGFNSKSLIASGDDELLLHKIYLADPDSVKFIKSKAAIVFTKPVEDLTQLFNQRKRWAGKWEKYLLTRTKIFALSVFCFHFSWILFVGLAIVNTLLLPVIITGFLTKAFFELVFVFLVMKFLGKKINLPAFILLQFVYSFYVVFFGLVSRGASYNWKGRKLN